MGNAGAINVLDMSNKYDLFRHGNLHNTRNQHHPDQARFLATVTANTHHNKFSVYRG